MRRLLRVAVIAGILGAFALPAAAQQPVQLGGTGASNTGADDKILIGNGAGQFVERSLVACTGADSALQYDAAGNAMGCATISGGHDIQLNGVALADQPILNFAGSASIIGCTSTGGKITCTITAAPTNHCTGTTCNLAAATQISGIDICLETGTNCPASMNFETGWSAKDCGDLTDCESKDTDARFDTLTTGQCDPSAGDCYYEASANWVSIDSTDLDTNMCRFGPTNAGRIEVLCDGGIRKLMAWTDEIPGSPDCPAGQAKVGSACQAVSRIKIDGVEYPVVDFQVSEEISFDPYGGTGTGATKLYLLPLSVAPSRLKADVGATPAVGECVKIDATDPTQFEYGQCLDGESDCWTLRDLAAADDDIPIRGFPAAVTLTEAWCHCIGTCTTEADIALEEVVNGAGTVNAVTGTITCEDMAATEATTALSGTGASVDALNVVRFDVSNSPSPETDDYLICLRWTVN